MVVVGVATVILVATGCTGGPATPSSIPSSDSATSTAKPKILTLALQQEPAVLSLQLAQANSQSGGAHLVLNILHNYLVVQDNAKGYQAQIAVEKPAIDKGTWRLNPDGTMDLTWRIHPNVRWQDGVPFTTDDLIFSFNVYKDPEIPNNVRQLIRGFESVSAPDPTTVIAHWSTPFVDADQAPGLQPLPRHLMEDQFLSDKAGFTRSTRLTTDFVGLGPYRLVHWEPGSYMEFTRFDDYFMGRPPLDGVMVRFVGDTSTIIANILSGAIDIVPPIGLEVDATIEVKRRWEGTGNIAIPQLRGGFRALEIQHRPEYARPASGFTNLGVRAGFYDAIDRRALADTMTGGLAPIADSWLTPDDPLRPQLEPWIPQFPYDPARAQALLAQAGWTRGSDGTLTNNQTSERFVTQLTARGPGDAKAQHIIADNWKAVGAQVELYEIPPALQSDRELTSTLSGSWLATLQPEHLTTDRFHSKSITSAATNWTGNNRGGYVNPKVDALLDRLTVTIPRPERIGLFKELLQDEMEDLPLIMLYWEGDILLASKGVSGTSGGGNSTWNFFQWNKD
ncbi:MAG: peptide/nickel transport system substrate-binding protein [Chloroflexota bacterium]|jgi:peptide/nickel transport system substrate-binding protein|nr:peptide/nickel transport system substrate-binding protein [Chloroflexota bacterium]